MSLGFFLPYLKGFKRSLFFLAEDNQVDSVTCQPTLTCAVSKGAFCFESSVSMMLGGSYEALRPYEGFPVRLRETGK